MRFPEALALVLDRGLAITRVSWKGSRYVMAIDPLKYPAVAGDDHEFIINYIPKNSIGGVRLAGPFDTKAEAESWCAEKKASLTKLWERFQRYEELRSLKADTPLDFAVKPEYAVDVVDSATIDKVPKMTSKRLGTKFLAVTVPGRTLEPYTPCHSDIFADDWKA